MANLVMGDYASLLTAETGLDHLLLLYWTVIQRYSQINAIKYDDEDPVYLLLVNIV